jgi:hypothetical protein
VLEFVAPCDGARAAAGGPPASWLEAQAIRRNQQDRGYTNTHARASNAHTAGGETKRETRVLKKVVALYPKTIQYPGTVLYCDKVYCFFRRIKPPALGA